MRGRRVSCLPGMADNQTSSSPRVPRCIRAGVPDESVACAPQPAWRSWLLAWSRQSPWPNSPPRTFSRWSAERKPKAGRSPSAKTRRRATHSARCAVRFPHRAGWIRRQPPRAFKRSPCRARSTGGSTEASPRSRTRPAAAVAGPSPQSVRSRRSFDSTSGSSWTSPSSGWSVARRRVAAAADGTTRRCPT